MNARQSRRIERRLETLHRHKRFGAAARIIAELQKRGFEAVFAGGCVRDGLLGRESKDLDIATSARPEDVEAAFAQTLAVGKAFGTIVVIEDGENFEVTTFRREGGYSDGRHPDRVEFTDMREDASRRDFTVNALFYDPAEETIFDFVNGVEDLEREFLETVGDAEDRFREDHLRMLRAARFVAQLGFVLDTRALEAIRIHHEQIRKVSIERVFNEMRRLLGGAHLREGLEILRDSKLESEVWPEIGASNLESLARFGPFLNWENAFAALMLLASRDDAEMVLRKWKASRESLRRVNEMIDGCRVLMNPASSKAARMRVLGGAEFAGVLQLAAGFLPGNAEIIQTWIHEFLEVTGKPGQLPQPFLTGQDLIALGVEPGEKMGAILKSLYEEQLEGRLRSREDALSAAKDLIED